MNKEEGIKNVIIVSGGFDPVHKGHIRMFREAANLGANVIIGLNSDEWLTRKKGKPFMTITERMSIIKELKCVDLAIEFRDDDNSACDVIKMALEIYDKVLFCNGGDRGSVNTPEYNEYRYDDRVEFKFGVGGTDKKNSSSWILKKWNML